MSNAAQYGSIPILDITMKNNGVSDIAANTAVLFDTSHAGGGDTPPGCVVPSSGGGVVGTAGITVETIKASGIGRVRFSGTIQATADGAITVGNYVQASDTNAVMGRVKLKGATVEQLGQALNTAADGQLVLVYVSKAATA